MADDGSTPETDYAYDATNNDRMTDIVYPDGRDITYDYGTGLDSVISRVSSIDDETGSIQTYSYLGLNTPIDFTDENGVTESTTLDVFGRISSMVYTNSSSGTVDSFSYGYDADGNVLYKKNGVLTNQSALYSYDNLNRLTNYSTGTLNSSNTSISGTPTLTESWNLDAQGNWQGTSGTNAGVASNAQNQITTANGNALTYDRNGNTTKDQNGNTGVYDAWNHLISVTVGTDTITYTYDALGRRITESDSASGTATDFYYSGQQMVQQVSVYTDGTTTTDEYVWSLFYVNQLVQENQIVESGFGLEGDGARDDSGIITSLIGTQYYAEQDADYNVTSLTNSSGTVVERYIYNPYGSVTVLTASGSVLGTGMASSTVGEVVGYQGGYEDPKTGLVHFMYRDDDTDLGRWIEQDPARYIDGPNVYQMEMSNPVARLDYAGLDWFDNVSNWAAGCGDTISCGATSYIRKQLGVDDAVDYNSTSYGVGQATGVVYQATLAVATAGGSAELEEGGALGEAGEAGPGPESEPGGPGGDGEQDGGSGNEDSGGQGQGGNGSEDPEPPTSEEPNGNEDPEENEDPDRNTDEEDNSPGNESGPTETAPDGDEPSDNSDGQTDDSGDNSDGDNSNDGDDNGDNSNDGNGNETDASKNSGDDLHRPYIRKATRQAIEDAAPRTADGRPIDPNTGQPIDGTPDLGHRPGNEFWREKEQAEAEGLTQKQFNDRMNDPSKYQLEDPSSNRSHKYEQP